MNQKFVIRIYKTLKRVKLLLWGLCYLPLFIAKRITPRIISNANLIIIDMDGTFTNYHTFKEALNLTYRDNGKSYDNVVMTDKKSANLTMDNQRMIEGLIFLKKGGFNKRVEFILIKNAIKKINLDLVKLVNTLKSKYEIILVSRSSDFIAKEISKKYGLAGGYGSIMVYDKRGSVIGTKRLITDNVPKNSEYSFSTKVDIAERHMKEKGLSFSMSKTIFISNDILDLDVMYRSLFSVLILDKERDYIDNVSYYLMLYDYLAENSNDIEELIRILDSKIAF